MQAAMDGYLCLLHLTTGVVIDNVFLPFATAAFFSFILVSIFGMRYLLVVWRIQRPESIRAQSQPASPAPEPSDESNNNDTSTDTLLPLANRPAVNRPSTTEESNPQRDVTYLYYRLCKVNTKQEGSTCLLISGCLYILCRCCLVVWFIPILSIHHPISICTKYYYRNIRLCILFLLDTTDCTKCITRLSTPFKPSLHPHHEHHTSFRAFM
jgi:hypothetical protein